MDISYLTDAGGNRIAYRHQPGQGAGVLWCGGYRSDMESGKALAIGEWCARHGVPFTRFDYFAHGASEGDFHEFTIGAAIASTLEILDQVAAERLLLVGSSMGGWVGLQAALQRPLQVQAFLGIAAAPDFTDRLMLARMSAGQRRQLEEEGVVYTADFEGNEYPITQRFLDEARRHFLLDHPVALSIPMHLLQGQRDVEVPWETALTIAAKLTGDEVAVTLVKDGDHRLNRPQDLDLLVGSLARLYERI